MFQHQTGKWILYVLLIPMALSVLSSAQAAVLLDETGRRVTVPSHPRRIVSLAPDITEILFALGLGKEVVGVSRFSDYPEAARTKPKVGSYIHLSLEKILGLHPDLVIGTTSGNRREAVGKLEKAGIPVYVANPRRFSDIPKTIVNIGRITGKETAARQLAADMKKRVDTIVLSTASCRKPKVFVQIDLNPIVSAGGNTICNELIGMAGGVNIAGRMPVKYPRYSMESLIKEKPDIILLSSMSGAKSRKAALDFWRRWQDIPAVRNGKITFINSDLTDRFSPRIVQGLEDMARILHPELFPGNGNFRGNPGRGISLK